ncbi:MAG: hypothetical protein ABSF59_15510 [Candidatus Sulfotelmatobacter sp.]|jgi:hypothetical protein
MRSDPITPEKREQIIAFMTGGLMNAYEYFQKEREGNLGVDAPEPLRLGGTTRAPVVGKEIQAVLRRGEGGLSAAGARSSIHPVAFDGQII